MLSCSVQLAYRASKGGSALRRELDVHVDFQLGLSICKARRMLLLEQKGVLTAETFDAASIFGPGWLGWAG